MADKSGQAGVKSRDRSVATDPIPSNGTTTTKDNEAEKTEEKTVNPQKRAKQVQLLDKFIADVEKEQAFYKEMEDAIKEARKREKRPPRRGVMMTTRLMIHTRRYTWRRKTDTQITA
jgi:hypothetical protein